MKIKLNEKKTVFIELVRIYPSQTNIQQKHKVKLQFFFCSFSFEFIWRMFKWNIRLFIAVKRRGATNEARQSKKGRKKKFIKCAMDAIKKLFNFMMNIFYECRTIYMLKRILFCRLSCNAAVERRNFVIEKNAAAFPFFPLSLPSSSIIQ